MSKLNKIITNQPIVLTEEEVNNLSETLSAVRTAGGGEGGHLYTGDNKYIGVDNGNYKIKFLDNAAQKLESISSKLDKTEAATTYLTCADAETTYQTKADMLAYYDKTETSSKAQLSAEFAKYQLSGNYVNQSDYNTEKDAIWLELQTLEGTKQNKLDFDTDAHGNISAINDIPLAGAGGVTGDYYSASNPSGFINSTQAETQILEKHYLTEASGDSLYVPIPEGLSEGQYYAMTTSSWKVIQGAGDVSGISTVAHDDTLTGNGNNENLGVDITKIQTKLTDTQIQNITDVTTLKTASSTWDNVSAKLNTSDFNTYTATTAPSTYQPLGNYLSSNALEGYATTALLDTISSKIESDIPTTVAQLTDSGNYYKKSETSGATELSTEFGKYALKSEIPTVPTKVSDLTDSANYYKTTETSSKNEITNALNTKVDKPTSQQTGKLVYDGDNNEWVTLPAGTATIVQGQGSVTANYDSQNSTYTVSLLASAENALLDVDKKTPLPPNNYSFDYAIWDNHDKEWVNPFYHFAPLLDEQSTVGTYYAMVNDGTDIEWKDISEYLEAEEYLCSTDMLPSNGLTGSFNSSNYKYSIGIDTTNMAANKQYAFTTTGWAEVQAGTSFTGVVTGTGLSGTGLSNSPLGIDTGAAIYLSNGSAKSAVSAGSATSALSADKAESAESAKWLREGNAHVSAGDVTALQNWASSNSSTWDSVSAKLTTAQYATDSATFYTTSNPAGYLTKTVADTYYQPTGSYATSAGLTAGNQYAMTTNGWAVVSTPTIPDITANNGLSANGHTIGIDNTNLVADTQYAWTTTGWSSVETAYLPLTGGTVTGQMTLTGTGWGNRLTIGRSNTAIDIGVALNGALTLKANVNNACQFNMMQTGTSGVDINITYGQTPSAIGNLYVMKTHTIAEATTASGSWNGDNLLHIILDS